MNETFACNRSQRNDVDSFHVMKQSLSTVMRNKSVRGGYL